MLITTQQFDHLMVAGNFNIDFSRSTASYRTLMNFFDHHALTVDTIDVQFGDKVGWTFESHSGYRTWIDRIAVSNGLLSRVLKVHTSDFVLKFSNHWPLFALFQLQFGTMSPNEAIKLECVPSVVWDKASVEDLQHYASLVDMKLKELSIPECFALY